MQRELTVKDRRPAEVEPRAEEVVPTAPHVRPRGPRVSVVMAALNEAENLRHVLPLVPADAFEVILVDGHSTDGTTEVAKAIRPDLRIVNQRGRGKGDALRCGFEAARGDIIVALDADGSTDPREIPAFVGALVGGADFAKGTRFGTGGGTEDMTFVRKLGNKGFLVLVRLLFGQHYTDLCYGYFAFWAHHLPTLQLRSDGFEIETETFVRAAVTKLRVVEVASIERARVNGKGHLRALPDGWRVLMEILRQAGPRRAEVPSATRLRRVVLDDSAGMESPD